MTNAGLLAGRRRCIFPHVFAAVMALLQAAFRVAAHGAVDADPQGSRERRWSRGLPRSWVEKKADAATGACSSADGPRGGGPKGLRPTRSRASLPGVAMCRALRAGFVFRRSSVSVSIVTRTALQNTWSFRERARLARRNSVSTRLMAFSCPSRATSSSTPQPRARMRMRCSFGEGVRSLWRSILDIGWRERAVTRSGCGGRLVVIVVFDRMVLEGQAFVEFGERNREANLRHLEGVVILEDKGAPSVLGADRGRSRLHAPARA